MAQSDPYDVLHTLLAASRWINRGKRLCDDLEVPVDMYSPGAAYDECDRLIKEAQEAAEEILKTRNSGVPHFGRF